MESEGKYGCSPVRLGSNSVRPANVNLTDAYGGRNGYNAELANSDR